MWKEKGHNTKSSSIFLYEVNPAIWSTEELNILNANPGKLRGLIDFSTHVAAFFKPYCLHSNPKVQFPDFQENAIQKHCCGAHVWVELRWTELKGGVFDGLSTTTGHLD